MPVRLLPCPDCGRHVRSSEGSCPFCQASLVDTFASAPAERAVTTRLGRAAQFAFGAVAATTMTVAGCGDGGGPAPLYGAPPEDSGMVGSDAGSGGDDAGSTPTDGGSTGSDAGSTGSDGGSAGSDGGSAGSDGGQADAGGGPVPAYGAPAPIDAGTPARRDAGGGIGPLYGGVPAD